MRSMSTHFPRGGRCQRGPAGGVAAGAPGRAPVTEAEPRRRRCMDTDLAQSPRKRGTHVDRVTSRGRRLVQLGAGVAILASLIMVKAPGGGSDDPHAWVEANRPDERLVAATVSPAGLPACSCSTSDSYCIIARRRESDQCRHTNGDAAPSAGSTATVDAPAPDPRRHRWSSVPPNDLQLGDGGFGAPGQAPPDQRTDSRSWRPTGTRTLMEATHRKAS
jgi:hypothetical protein